MFNEKIVKSLSELSVLNSKAQGGVELYLDAQKSLAENLPCTSEELMDVIYDHEDDDIVIEALEILAIDRDPKCKVVLSDIMNAHPVDKVKERSRQLLFNVITLETAKEFSLRKDQ